ncbi:MAG: hypothetical protein NTY19_08690 [Planctomycetota bacterium]|nr:hypothetical protein [Planctomycetota bacterium]
MTSLTIPNRADLLRGTDAISVAVERHFWLCATLLVVLLLACSIVADVRTKVYSDEFFTLHVSQQASPGEIVKATLEGCDGAPPLYPMLVRAILPWVRHEALALRLPATLGYCAMVLCLLAFCRRRLPAVYALIAALLACNACLVYATNGRPYGVVLGCAAGALLGWQTAADGRRRILAIPLLAFCLALMTAMHYYSLFFLVPLFQAEVMRWRTSGKLDFAVLAAMAPALVVLGLHYPLMAANKPFLEHYWSPVTWDSIPALYASYLVKMCLLPLGVLVVFSKLFSEVPHGQRARQTGLTAPEWVAVGTFLLMPLGLIVLSQYTTHVFVERYTLWALTGIAVLVAALLYAAARGISAVGVGTLSLLLFLFALSEANVLCRQPVLLNGEAVLQELSSLTDSSAPIVVAHYAVFLELSYYAAPRLRERLIYPVSRDLYLRYVGVDTPPLIMSALSHRTQLSIIGYDAVLAAHPRFILAAIPGDFLPRHLVTAGYQVLPISLSRSAMLYQVEAPGGK